MKKRLLNNTVSHFNQNAYNCWSDFYDIQTNATRDLEGEILRKTITGNQLNILEIGCGTGKNTGFLITKANQIQAIDFSEKMMAIAQQKFSIEKNITFETADITQPWSFAKDNAFDLIVFSLVLEHIQNLDFIFEQACQKLKTNGKIYMAEYHPYRQLDGKKARFDLNGETIELQCFNHSFQEFFQAATLNSFKIIDVIEHQTETDTYPRILKMMFEKI